MAFMPSCFKPMQHQSHNRKNNRTPDPDIPAENMEQPDRHSTLWGSSQNLGIQKLKNQDDSSTGRAMLEKGFLYFGRELQIEPPWIETTSPPTHDGL